ncbi:GNAT family N-acetyltransferase [Thermomonas sp.]|uniref:GNAT family N-acetyltransferase n=1 Tax=Thermomonas sp. TaxID=1971895 RepID=UPI002488474E|nr:GNAT family N-acetyltransferase [Thermomonas sp.]MDI1253250.1 GNAT family N-acetyltransferase [Thermomonas sp.]
MSQSDPLLQPFRVELVEFQQALAELRAVRDEVFVGEQNVPIELEHDALDPLCIHVIARLLDGTPIGTGRLTPERHIGRMAVRAPWRGRGVGDALLLALVEQARLRGWADVHLNAQVSAMSFYERHGFQPEGDRFMAAGMEHQAMQRPLDGPRVIERRQDAIETITNIITAARRTVWIRSFTLDPGLFDPPDVMQALRSFATSGRGNEVRILLHDATTPQRNQASMLALAQRLPSVFLFRELVDPADRNDPAAWIASDAGGYYLRALGERIEGEAELHAPAHCRQLRTSHNQAWERARPVSEYRALGL